MTSAEYPAEMVTWALQAIIVAGGNVAEAHRDLEAKGGYRDDQGFGHGTPSVRTLRHWKNSQHSQRYLEMEQVYSGELETQLVALARENARKSADATRQLVDQVLDDIQGGRLRGRDAAQSAVALSKVTGQNVTDVLRLTNRPVDGNPNEMNEAMQWLVDQGILVPRSPSPVESPVDVVELAPADVSEVA